MRSWICADGLRIPPIAWKADGRDCSFFGAPRASERGVKRRWQECKGLPRPAIGLDEISADHPFLAGVRRIVAHARIEIRVLFIGAREDSRRIGIDPIHQRLDLLERLRWTPRRMMLERGGQSN